MRTNLTVQFNPMELTDARTLKENRNAGRNTVTEIIVSRFPLPFDGAFYDLF